MKRALLILLVLLPRLASAQGGERILSYDSFIKVNPAGDMTVTETIRVVCEGTKIRHGIYRDVPTRYKDRFDSAVRVAFEVDDVQKDGKPEPWWSTDRDNGVRVYVGSKNVTLEPGEYSYALTYRTTRQLGFFEKHDELYWNVTGNGWEFPIEKVSATVELPPGATILSTGAYTGSYGETGTDFTASTDSHGRALFVTTRPLQPREGLTIVVMWPKGVIREPTMTGKAAAFISENGSTAAGAAGVVVLFIYYLSTWLKIGRDPEHGVIIPLSEAPAGWSPAALRYVMRMGFDDKTCAAALVNMAVKGYITIDEDADGGYTLARTGRDDSGLSRDEALIARRLFRTGTSLAIKTENHAALRQAIKDLQKSLAVEYEKIYFLTNKGTLIPGLIISVLALATVVALSRGVMVAGFMTLWLSGWTAGCSLLVVQAVKTWRRVLTARDRRASNLIGAVIFTLFVLPFLAGEGLGLWMFSKATSLPAVLCIFALVLLTILFYHLMKVPTIKGRQVMDQIDGLKLYLSAAGKDRLTVLTPPERTPVVFEKFLPYAMALDVEQEWCDRFADVLSQASRENRNTIIRHRGGLVAAGGTGALASSLGALSSSISSAASPPGSRSGGGGGSSGGGGGGGGGGGW